MSGNLAEALGYELDPTPWIGQAACVGEPPSRFFPSRGQSLTPARSICQRCPVRPDCLGYALRWRIDFGVWGGLSERQRRRLKKPPLPRRLPPPHGTAASYAAGCQCGECTFANAQYRASNRKRPTGP